jgi:plastocyanin
VNKDSDPHVSASVPGAPQAFTVVHPPGKSTSLTFTKPGVYPYYCVDHATYNPTLHRVVARKETDKYPLAMEGVIVVRGAGFAGAPAASVSITRNGYTPHIVVVKSGGQVTWTNADAATHALVAVGAGGPPLTLAPGKNLTVSFGKPGIYLFYDPRSATYESDTGLAAAKKGSPGYPVSIQGYVVVL